MSNVCRQRYWIAYAEIFAQMRALYIEYQTHQVSILNGVFVNSYLIDGTACQPDLRLKS